MRSLHPYFDLDLKSKRSNKARQETTCHGKSLESHLIPPYCSNNLNQGFGIRCQTLTTREPNSPMLPFS